MSGAFQYQQNSGGGRPKEVFRGEVDLENSPVFEAIDYDNGKYAVPSTGEYTLQVTGFTKPREEAVSAEYRKPDGPETRTLVDVELEIVGPAAVAGFRFYWSFQTFSLGGGDNPSNLRRIYIAGHMQGAIPPDGAVMMFDELIGKPFMAYVIADSRLDDKGRPKFAKLSRDTIRPVPAQGTTADPFAQALAQAS